MKPSEFLNDHFASITTDELADFLDADSLNKLDKKFLDKSSVLDAINSLNDVAAGRHPDEMINTKTVLNKVQEILKKELKL